MNAPESRDERGPYTQEPQLMLFRRRLSSRMRALGLTAAELAEEVEVCERQVWFWAGGYRVPNAVSLIRLSRALDVPADWLLGASPTELAGRCRTMIARRPGDEPTEQL